MSLPYAEVGPLLNETKHVELSGKGASEDEVLRAEARLNVPFPDSYRMFLKEHGWGHFASLGLISGLGSDIPEGWEAGASIVRVAIQEREGPLSLPRTMLPFYTNGAGDWYAMDCSRLKGGEAPIVYVSHEKCALGEDPYEDVAPDFPSWLSERLGEE